MAVEESILKSTKKILGLDDAYDSFDLDVITHINSTFFVLKQLGVGPSSTFAISGDEEKWDDFFRGDEDFNAVKTYLWLKVKSLFDPPGTPHHITAMNEQIAEFEYRLKMEREIPWATLP